MKNGHICTRFSSCFNSQAFHAVLERQRLVRSHLEEENSIRTTQAMAVLCQVCGLLVGPAENLRICVCVGISPQGWDPKDAGPGLTLAL